MVIYSGLRALLPLHGFRVDEVLFFGVHACAVLRGALVPPPPPCGHHSCCMRPCIQGFPSRRLARGRCGRAPWPCSAVKVLGWSGQSPPGCYASHVYDSSDSSSRCCVSLAWCLLVRKYSSTNSDLHWRNQCSLPCLFMANPGVRAPDSQRPKALSM